MPARRTLFISLLLLCALLAVTGYVYSSWHQHERLPGKVCNFSQFEHSSSPQPSLQIQILPDVHYVWRSVDNRTIHPSAQTCEQRYGRAPPA